MINAELARDNDFGLVLTCAIRYAIGRRTYMPGVVAGVVNGLIPDISDSTLQLIERDIIEADCYGDPTIDEPIWVALLGKVRQEMSRRGLSSYPTLKKGAKYE